MYGLIDSQPDSIFVEDLSFHDNKKHANNVKHKNWSRSFIYILPIKCLTLPISGKCFKTTILQQGKYEAVFVVVKALKKLHSFVAST